jgi:hypothetical protein
MLYYVCRLDDAGQWVGLHSFDTEDHAERYCDALSEEQPFAYIDVLTYDEFHGGPVKWAAMAIN